MVWPTVSIIIPNYNGASYLRDCLASLRELDYPTERYEVIVVDNASTDDSIAVARQAFPAVQVVVLPWNQGFAAAANAGARTAGGEVLAFLNNDMRVAPDWLRALVAPLQAETEVACTGGLILDWEGTRVDFAGGVLNFYGHGFQPAYGLPRAVVDLPSEPVPVLFACGGAMAIRRAVFQESGGFDPDYFAYMEDVDLGWRLWVLGYRVLFVPAAVAYHRGHATGRRIPWAQRRLLYERNALATIIKNYDEVNLARALPAALLLMARRALARGQIDPRDYAITVRAERPDASSPGPTEAGATTGEQSASLVESTAVQTVSADLLSHLVAMGLVAEEIERLWAKRQAIQQRRRRPDREIVPLFRAPFETNDRQPAHLRCQMSLQQVFGVTAMFAPFVRPRVLLVLWDVVGETMAGPAIRYWEMARVLSREVAVTLAARAVAGQPPAEFVLVAYGDQPERLRALVEQHEVIVTQGFVLHHFPFVGESGRVLVVDLYDPFTLEGLVLRRERPRSERWQVHDSDLEILNVQLRRGDFFLCASERQRDYWLGMLAANGRLNPDCYDADPTFRSLIDVVPFGLPAEPPRSSRPVLKGVYPGIAPTDRVILWGGGVWEWLDPLTAIRALALVRAEHPEVKLFFLGTRSPNPDVPEMPILQAARALSRELGLLETAVFFNETWVPYHERAGYLLEADIGLSLHRPHLEARFAFRTRLLDYIWAGLPIICTRGDDLAEQIAAAGVGVVVDPECPEQVAGAIRALLAEPDARAMRADRFARLRADLTWERAVEPLRRFCLNPRPAPDRGRPTAPTADQRRPDHGEKVPPTPLWRLPLKAVATVRAQGLAGLLTEAGSYLLWLGQRAQTVPPGTPSASSPRRQGHGRV